MDAMLSFNNSGAAAYQSISNISGVEDADPHKLIDMLYTAALDRIANAKGELKREDTPSRGKSISKAISIIEELRGSLNMEAGGEISTNLHDLYEYMKHQLLQANMDSNMEILDEVNGLIEKLRSGWRQIPMSKRNSQHQG
jgi:flagellar protein FliS